MTSRQTPSPRLYVRRTFGKLDRRSNELRSEVDPRLGEIVEEASCRR